MKTAQRPVLAFALLPALALWAGCADSPIAPSQSALVAQGSGVPDAASFDSAVSTSSAADPLLLSVAKFQDASCTVQLVKTEVFDPDKGKEGDWVAYDGGVLATVAPGELFFKYELKVNIPAKHFVTFQIENGLLQPNTTFRLARFDTWKPRRLDGELAGNKSVQLEFRVPNAFVIGNDKVDVKGNTFEVTPNWACWTGFADEVARGPLSTFKFQGVEKKKKK